MCNLCQLAAALTVRPVTEARVVALQVATGVKRPVGDEVQVGDVSGEPGHYFLIQYQDGATLRGVRGDK